MTSPLTTTEKQRRRRAALDTIAQAAGWRSWGEYETAVKRNEVRIAASRANGQRGGRPKKEQAK